MPTHCRHVYQHPHYSYSRRHRCCAAIAIATPEWMVAPQGSRIVCWMVCDLVRNGFEWREQNRKRTNRFNRSPLIASRSFLNDTISRCSMWSLLLVLRNSSLICLISMLNDWIVFSIFLSILSMASVITSLSSFLRPNNNGSMYC